jgi:hypothetical protein
LFASYLALGSAAATFFKATRGFSRETSQFNTSVGGNFHQLQDTLSELSKEVCKSAVSSNMKGVQNKGLRKTDIPWLQGKIIFSTLLSAVSASCTGSQ